MKKILSLCLMLVVLSTAVYAVEESTPSEDETRIIKVFKSGSEDEKECRIITIDEITDLEDLNLEESKVVKIVTCDKTDGEKKVLTRVFAGDMSKEEIEHAIQEAMEGCDKMDLADLEKLEGGKKINVFCLKLNEEADECTLEIAGEEITLDLDADIAKQLEDKIDGDIKVTEENGLTKIVITQDTGEE